MKQRSLVLVVVALVLGLLPIGGGVGGGVAHADDPLTGELSGTVADFSNLPVDGLTIEVLEIGADVPIAATTSSLDGSWSVGGLPAGQYVARITWADTSTDYQPGVRNRGAAQVFSVPEGGVVGGVNFVNNVGGSISGTIRRDGQAVEGAAVVLDNDQNTYVVQTDAAGGYTITDVHSGEYRLMASTSSRTYAVYGGQTHSTQSTLWFGSGSGTQYTGIDLDIVFRGSISGRVDHVGSGVAGATVQFRNEANGHVFSTTTDASGNYSSEYLPHGDYRVSASINGNTWYHGGAADLWSATVVGLGPVPALDATGVDISMPSITQVEYGSITGQVTRASAPVNSGGVNLRSLAGAYVQGTSPDANGQYTFTGVPVGEYKVSAAYPGWADAFHGGDSFETASIVTVTANATTTGIDLAYAPAIALSGTVTRAGQPVGGASISVYDSMGMWRASTTTQPDGTYSVEVSAGSYRIQAMSDGLSQFYGGGTDLWQATTVTVNAPGDPAGSGLDIALPPTVPLSGTVTRAGQPVSGASITVYTSMGMWQAGTSTDVDGSYSVSVPAGSYRIQVNHDGVSRYYGGPDYMQATVVTVSGPGDPAASGLDVALPVTGSVSGTLTRNGQPLLGMPTVFLVNSMSMWVQSTMVNPDGTFVLSGVTPGVYRLATNVSMTASAYYVAGGTATTDWTAGSTIEVSEVSPQVTGISFALPPVGEIRGSVMAGDVGVASMSVIAVPANCTVGCQPSSAMTDSNGSFVIANVPHGSYIVYAASMMTQYFFGGTNAANATVVELSTENPLQTGVDIALPPGRIEGTLTYRGQPVPYATVTAQPTTGMSSSAATDANGQYRILALAPGDYALSASSSMYGTVVYGGGTTFDPGVRVAITAADPVESGVDIAFGPGEVSGIVTRLGQPVANAVVIATPGGTVPGSTAVTDANGQFVVRGIATSTVKLAVRPDPMAMGAPLWYGGTSEATATDIVLSGDPPAASGIVFEVPTGGISLTVTNGGNAYGQGYAVLVRADDANQYVQQDSNAFDGFSFPGVAPGTYKVRFHTAAGMYGCGCTWVGGSSFATATSIVVADTTVAVGLELGLGSISGTVTSDGQPVTTGGQVTLYSGPEGSPSAEVRYAYLTAGQSTFTVDAVPAGTYSLKFSSTGPPFRQFWDGGAGWADADRIEVLPGAVVAGVEVAPPLGSISGRVTDAAGEPIAGAYVNAYWSQTAASPSVVTDADGRYTVPHLGPGTYFMLFSPPNGVNSVPEWSGGVVAYGENSIQQASTFALAEDEGLTGIDAVLDDGATISGCVTDESGEGIPNLHVMAGVINSNGYLGYIGNGAASGADGCYHLVGLGSGEVQLSFNADPNQMLPQFRYVLSEFWDDAYVYTGATLFPIALGDHVTGKDAVLEVGARGTATVTEGGVALPSTQANVAICRAPATLVSAFQCSNNEGPLVWSRSFGPLPPGEYNVHGIKGSMLSSLTVGPAGLLTVGLGDVVHCVAPMESAPTCEVLSDGDGVPAAVEADAPNQGDGNADGVPDAEQDEVTSLPDPTGGFVTVESVDDLPLASVSVVDPASVPVSPPSNVDPQSGLVAFTVSDLPPAVTTTSVKVFLSSPANSYWKYDDVAGWVDATSLVAFSPDGMVATITLTDGAFGDQDGVVNGAIVDPGVFAVTDHTVQPLEVTLTGGPIDEGTTATITPLVSGAIGALAVHWDLGADGTVDGTDATFPIVAGNGPRTVVLAVTVTDADGRSATAQAVYTVVNVSPSAGELSVPARVKPNERFVVSISGVSDVPGERLWVRFDCGSGTFGWATRVRHREADVECRAPRAQGPITVRAKITDGEGGETIRVATVLVTRPSRPGVPSGLTATPGRRSVSLSWRAPEDDGGAEIEGYVVEVSDDGGRSWDEVEADERHDRDGDRDGDRGRGRDDVTTTATTFVVTGLRAGGHYVVRVRAVNEVGTSAPSPTVSVRPR